MRFGRFAMAAAVALVVGNGAAFAADGAVVYKGHCAKCHGDTGKADTPTAKALKVRAIAGDAKVAGMSDADLIAQIKANKKHAALKLSDADLAAVATYVKQLASEK
jgi:mono/diheme cytochrome c family protein